MDRMNEIERMLLLLFIEANALQVLEVLWLYWKWIINQVFSGEENYWFI